MTVDGTQPRDEVIVLPPVPLDPVFADAVDDAVAGEQEPTSPFDPDRLLGADPHDFAGLYIRHRHSFGLHARRFLRDQRDVDEVVQEAFLRLFLALPELGNELQALAYCRRTITNLCIDRYRADQRRPRLIDLDSVPSDVLSEEEADDPVVQAEDAAIVREALALLSPLHREALVKREIEEKPLPVIAEELGVPEDSVKHLLHRARRALRRRLAETHLAPGADLDDVSTLSLLGRTAAAGTGRVGVLLLIFAGVVAGVSPNTPVKAIASITGLWHDVRPAGPGAAQPEPPRPEPDAPSGQTGAVPDQGQVLDGPVELPLDAAVPRGPVRADAAAGPVEPAAAGVPDTRTATTSPSPRPSAQATVSPRPSAPALPVLEPQPKPSRETSPSASPTPAGEQDAPAAGSSQPSQPAAQPPSGGPQQDGPLRPTTTSRANS